MTGEFQPGERVLVRLHPDLHLVGACENLAEIVCGLASGEWIVRLTGDIYPRVVSESAIQAAPKPKFKPGDRVCLGVPGINGTVVQVLPWGGGEGRGYTVWYDVSRDHDERQENTLSLIEEEEKP